jgi:hypothetical protein
VHSFADPTGAASSAAHSVKVAKAVKTVTKQFKAAKKTITASKKIVKACNCFVAGTKVLTDKGEKPIEDIEIGDRDLSKNEDTGEIDYKEVTQLFLNEKYTTYN